MKKRYYSYFMKIILVFMIFGFVLTSLLDFNRAMQAREYQLELDAMARVASQGSLVLETKLSGYLKKLSAMAEFFSGGRASHRKEYGDPEKYFKRNAAGFSEICSGRSGRKLLGDKWIMAGRIRTALF